MKQLDLIMLFRYHMLNFKHYVGAPRKIMDMEQKLQLIFEVESMELASITANNEIMTFDSESEQEKELKVRLDKWLWAARFFKTRALARAAVEQGKVLYNDQKTIPSKEIAVGSTVFINQGKMKKKIVIRRLSTRRRSNDEANALFEFMPIDASIETEADKEALLENAPLRRMVRFLRRPLSSEDHN